MGYFELQNRIFAENGLAEMLDVSRETSNGTKTVAELLSLLTERLSAMNAVMNLTAVRDEEGIVFLHYADSLKISALIPPAAKVCDVGCGAGFPSLPLAIARADLSILALDSTDKKVRYVAETAEMLGVSDVLSAQTARAEVLGQGAERESFDVVTARAVSNLRMLSELCLPLVRVGGAFLSMKGANWEAEWADAEGAVKALGGELERVETFDIRNGEAVEKRAILVIRKASATPKAYPRAWGKIKSKPL